MTPPGPVATPVTPQRSATRDGPPRVCPQHHDPAATGRARRRRGVRAGRTGPWRARRSAPGPRRASGAPTRRTCSTSTTSEKPPRRSRREPRCCWHGARVWRRRSACSCRPTRSIAELQPGLRTTAVQISSPPRSVRAGDSFVLTAVPLDPAGQPLHDAPVLWSSTDVQVAVVTAGGWVAALGRGQAVLTATSGLASGSVTIYVEQTLPAPAPHRSPPRVAPPLPAEREPPHHSSWRRRGTRRRPARQCRCCAPGRGSLGVRVRAARLRVGPGATDSLRQSRSPPLPTPRWTPPSDPSPSRLSIGGSR